MASGTIRIDVDGHVATLTISRPEKLNALDLDMLKALADAADEVEANANVRAAILTGEGKGFSAGGDIKAWGGMLPQEFGHLWVRHGHRIFERLATLRMPLVAALNGHALGGGLELAGVADIRLAEEQIKIGLPETGLGMVPGWSGTQRLVRRFGAQAVRRMALGGEIFTAEEARLLGIVDVVVPTGNALAAAREYAQRIAARGPAATEIAKLMIASANGEDNGTAVEALGSILAAKTGDLKEGVASFSEKRPATFKGEW
ncbi:MULTISPECIES: enoyl-CoA hydratase/isomerase family protein [Rhizobium]|uniref:Enoyl-CoA hydratase/isomerase family protein n=1 Tax=Rhizobium leguminosarum bv. viciae TaxID=387 RepID=A0A8I2GUF8_RHILV|nr:MULTISPECIES: enoyl-CoA hydratase/isomerase family protein [Rhizobium]ASR06836.1 enoyl-CoA hydratase/isomerase family protein [Rhizobium leguminosarum bv. viciae]KAF5885124.1 enoyl-CoA hydratase/isomerase family protein [Rhizobium sp. PEPV16]MBY5625673.1 enoyl-CoA hydratase/isomerase family protein [Rhizobium leguminosarum]MBY5781219.1 enoyl-CoA hydratase/isomerase family protein [Rhizobium leguminosarum]MBY5783147.1 enoyl-CoA hydratase/isomerase family protein [Rhizobium leguminosarum]